MALEVLSYVYIHANRSSQEAWRPAGRIGNEGWKNPRKLLGEPLTSCSLI